jgi:transposase
MAKTRDHRKLELRRRKAARLFDQGISAADVARRLGVARQVGYRWMNVWRKGGADALASKGRAGPKPRLLPRQTGQLIKALLKGPGAHGYKTQLWTLPRVAALIEKLTGVRYHPGHVWKLLGALGFSCQRPERRAVERDEPAIRHWKQVEWPAIKKKRAASTGSSSSSTKAD